MQTFTIHKAAVRSEHGLVAAQNRHAAEAGAAVLSRGGNAIDAAVVTSMVLSVVEPWLSGVGGGGFLVRADGKTGAVDTLDFNVRAADGVDPKDYPLTDGRWRQLVQLAGRGRRAQRFGLRLDLRAGRDRRLCRGAREIRHDLVCRGIAAGNRARRARA